MQHNRKELHTNGRDDLRLEAELIREAAGKIADAILAVAADIRNLADMVEHLAAGEEEYGDQADSSPYVPVLHERDNNGMRGAQEGDNSEYSCSKDCNTGIIDRPDNRRSGPVRQLAANPSVHALRRFGPTPC